MERRHPPGRGKSPRRRSSTPSRSEDPSFTSPVTSSSTPSPPPTKEYIPSPGDLSFTSPVASSSTPSPPPTKEYIPSPKSAASSSLPATGSSRRLFDAPATGSSRRLFDAPAAGSSIPAAGSSQFTPRYQITINDIMSRKDISDHEKIENIYYRYFFKFKEIEPAQSNYFINKVQLLLESFADHLIDFVGREIVPPENIPVIHNIIDAYLLRINDESLKEMMLDDYGISEVMDQIQGVLIPPKEPLSDITHLRGGSKSKKKSKKKSKRKSKKKSKKKFKKKSKKKSKRSKRSK